MDIVMSMEIIAGICGIVLGVALLKNRLNFLFTFLLRIGMGIFQIVLANKILATYGIAISVGLNPVSLLTAGILGFPGVVLLFVIMATQNL